MNIASSMSSPPILASSSLSLLSLSLAMRLSEPTELLTALLSCASEPHGTEFDACVLGESSIMLLTLPLLCGMFMALCVMTGDESGLLSAKVE